ncbi:EVE domain-containing protein, partial [Parvibaculum sp.]|uniref:EVE domain-containing protein n=1 Tax=Parvibaculum sp. TaxID=2024848 RepID=UPI003C752F19
VDVKRMVGLVRVIGEHRPDPTDETGRFGLVDIEAVCDLPVPVSLSDVKNEPALAEMALLKQSRLSVQPVRPEEWKLICKMAGLKKIP